MQRISVRTRFLIPLFAMALALAFAPAAFADSITAGGIDSDDPSAPFGPGAALENAEIVFDKDPSFKYTGKEIKPSFSVWLTNAETGEKELLTKGTDYEVFYKENVNAGKGYAVAWCQDEEHMYTKTKSFKITKAPLKSAKIVIGRRLYTGKALKPTPKVTYKGMKLKKGTDFTVTYKKNKNAGLAKAIIKGKGNYKGTKGKAFRIVKANVADARFTTMKDKVYTGSAIKPKVNVKYKGKKLAVNKDYTIKYKNNKNVGTASIQIKGKGNFKGKKILQFEITKASITKCDVSYQKSWYWNGSLIKPPLTVTYKGKKLTEGTDYLVGYANNSEVGTAQISIQGKGNFTGSERLSFNINLLPLKDSSISTVPLNGTLYNYTGNSVLPEVTVKISSGGKSYIVSPSYYDVFYKHGSNFYTRAQAEASGVFKGNAKSDRIYYIRIQAKEGIKYFTGYRTIKYTILKQAS